MRILYYHHTIDTSGAARSLALLISELVSRHHVEAFVVIPRRIGNAAVSALFKEAGAQVIEEQSVRPFHGSTVAPNKSIKEKLYALAGYLPLMSCSRRLIEKLQPDLVHLNSTCLVAAAHGTRLSDLGTPVIAHVREPILANGWGGLLRRLNLHHVNHFISIDAEGDRSLNTSMSERSIVRNSVDNALFQLGEADRRLARKQLGWDDNDFILLSLSRLTPWNGALELARAISRIEGHLPGNARVVIAGFGPLPGTLYEREVRGAMTKGTRCLEVAFSEDVVPLLAACDAVIAPFITNHSARSVFEAAAAARPALVSRLPNLTELIVEGETGISFIPNDDESLLQAVSRLWSDEMRHTMGANARTLAHERHDQRRNASAVMSIYDGLAPAKPTSARPNAAGFSPTQEEIQ